MSSTATSATRVFICYRRGDSAAAAGRLHDRLEAHFDKGSIFQDVYSIPLGTDFHRAIETAIGSCRIVLVIIGPRWLDAVDAAGRRRLDDPADPVRLEIEAALWSGALVVPVLVDDARIPAEFELPGQLSGLSRKQSFRLPNENFHAEVDRLVGLLLTALHPDVPRRTEQAGAPSSPFELPAAFHGSWVGTVRELGSPYPLRLQLHQVDGRSSAGEFEYPTLGASGWVEFRGMSGDVANLREHAVGRRGLMSRLRYAEANATLRIRSGELIARWYLGCKGTLRREG
jgi:hypothetical protein